MDLGSRLSVHLVQIHVRRSFNEMKEVTCNELLLVDFFLFILQRLQSTPLRRALSYTERIIGDDVCPDFSPSRLLAQPLWAERGTLCPLYTA